MNQTDKLNLVTSRLRNVSSEPSGEYRASCPTSNHPHGDRSRGLYIGAGDNGGLVFKCWSGCGGLEIVEALGLEPDVLFADQESKVPGKLSSTWAKEAVDQVAADPWREGSGFDDRTRAINRQLGPADHEQQQAERKARQLGLNPPPRKEPEPSAGDVFLKMGLSGKLLDEMTAREVADHFSYLFTPDQDILKRWSFQWAAPYALPKGSISMVVAPANTGKTSFAFHLLEVAARQKTLECYYWHADSSPGDAKHFSAIAQGVENLHYMAPGMAGTLDYDVMEHSLSWMARQAGVAPGEGPATDQVHCFDSFSDFCEDVNNKAVVKLKMREFRALRDAGATVLIMHHPNKRQEDGEWLFDGVNNIKALVDHLFYLDPGELQGDMKPITVRADKFRGDPRNLQTEYLLNISTRAVEPIKESLDQETLGHLDWLLGELLTVPFLKMAQAEELLRAGRDLGRNAARKLVEDGLQAGKLIESSGLRNYRLIHHPENV